MVIPQLNTIVNLNALQIAVTQLLLDDPRLANTPIVPELKFIMESDQSVDALWMLPSSAFVVTPSGVFINDQTPPSGSLVGAGLLIEMPGASTDSPKVSGPPLVWDINIVAFEERNTNFLAGTGTLITAEQYALIVLDILHLKEVYQFGTLTAKTNALTLAHDWMQMKPGIYAFRASLQAVVGRNQSGRSKPVVIAFTAGSGTDTVTLTCADGAASVYYTTDQSMPVSANVKPNNQPGIGATLYTAPFVVNSGTLVLAASSKPGLVGSSVLGSIAP
jgi:hypothetical protein